MTKPINNTPCANPRTHSFETKKCAVTLVVKKALEAFSKAQATTYSLVSKALCKLVDVIIFVIDILKYGKHSARLISKLKNAGIDITQNQKAVFNKLKYKDPFTNILLRLQAEIPLSSALIGRLFAYQDPYKLVMKMNDLKDENLLNQNILDAVTTHDDPHALVCGILELHEEELLDDYLAAIIQHKDPADLAKGLRDLQNCEMLDEKTLHIVSQHSFPRSAALFLIFLNWHNLQNEDNQGALLSHENCLNLASILTCLIQNHIILTQECLNQLLGNPLLTAETTFQEFWAQIPSHIVNLELINELHQASLQPDARNQILALRDRLLQNLPQAPNDDHALEINGSQSTHTTSVHKSSSESAVRLYQKYHKELKNLDALIAELQQDIKASNHDKKDVALRCIDRITHPHYQHVDPTSQVSTKQLSGLMHLSKGRLDNVIEALFEAQREYKIDDKGNEQGGPDAPACAGGVFNKLIQGLEMAGVPEAKIIFITKETSTLKLQATVKLYCKTKGIKDIEENWQEILQHLKNEMAEYAQAFSNKAEFEEFLEGGKWVDVSEQ